MESDKFATVKTLRGEIAAIDKEAVTAKIKTWDGIVEFSLRQILTFAPRGDAIYRLEKSLIVFWEDTYDVYNKDKCVVVGLNEDNEAIWVKPLEENDPVYQLEFIKMEIERDLVKEEYKANTEDVEWLRQFFLDHWKESTPNPIFSLGQNNTITCFWVKAQGWEFNAEIDLTDKSIKGKGKMTGNSYIEVPFSTRLDYDQGVRRLLGILDVIR